jgi:hypothetical protein
MEKRIDPRQSMCLQLYKDPASETFGNMYQSALRSGYSEAYADEIVNAKPAWLMESTQKDVELVQRAENNLKEMAELDTRDEATGKINPELARIKLDVSKFVAKTLARAKYSEDKEDGPSNIQVVIVNYGDKKPTQEEINNAPVIDIKPE